ncbi:hypothetical protein [Fretibacter rubidus]|uniref:hypothetical protein n=1 Tax=Fretibacter rubidus TaxID=570162 RepID=UPI00352A41CE
MISFMKKSAVVAALSLSLVACSGGDKTIDTTTAINAAATPEAALEIATKEIADMSPVEMMEYATVNSNALADKMALVNDEATARAVIAELKSMGPRMEAMGEKLQNIDQAELGLSLKTMSVAADFGKAQMRLAAEGARIAKDHPELRSLFEEEFGDVEIKVQ